jgi:hypothetical protein
VSHVMTEMMSDKPANELKEKPGLKEGNCELRLVMMSVWFLGDVFW